MQASTHFNEIPLVSYSGMKTPNSKEKTNMCMAHIHPYCYSVRHHTVACGRAVIITFDDDSESFINTET